jgi:hypothetical protein
MSQMRSDLKEAALQKGRFRSSFFLLFCILLLFFNSSFNPKLVQFSNDGPLGGMQAEHNRLPAILTGYWQDLNWLGSQFPAPPPAISTAIRLVTTPLIFSKFFAPISLLVAGLCAWICFRQLKLSPLAALLGSFAVTLNSGFFSVACWGVASQTINAGVMYLALGMLAKEASPKRRWLNTIVAGLAVGIGVMEAYDIGALYSMLIAAFVVYHALTSEGPAVVKMGRGILRVGVVALFAAFISAQAISTLVSTQIKGVAGAQQDTRTKAERWDWATQWSFPKSETLSIFIPGLFGYRMDTPKDMEMFGESFEGGVYWGGIGRDPAWDRFFSNGQKGTPPAGFIRFSGGGCYVGVLVALVAFWAALQACRRQNSVFTLAERKLLWFWMAASILSLLLAYGRFAPFYKILYQLPYFSTIRNPAKFLHIFGFSLIIVFTYGIDGLSRRYLQVPSGSFAGVGGSLKNWWPKASQFEKRWVYGCAAAVVVTLLGWLLYSTCRPSLELYLLKVQFDESMAQAIAKFSIAQVGWFLLFFVASAGAIVLMFSGAFAGKRSGAAAVALGVVLIADLGRANLPWLIYWDYKQKYASNPVIDFLREKPYEHRVAILPFRPPPQYSLMEQLYRIEWAQHHFQYYNIQSLDVVQMPRVPEDLAAYEAVLQSRGTPDSVYLFTRKWILTNTRYLLGPRSLGGDPPIPTLEALNRQLDPELRRFRIVEEFSVVAKPGIAKPTMLEELTAELKPGGEYALFEFTGALPRAKLYSNWQVPMEDKISLANLSTNSLTAQDLEVLHRVGTNDFLTLAKLASPTFDPAQTVLIATGAPPASLTGLSNQNPGTVEFTSYAPKHLKLKANANVPSILLLNDHYDPNWKVLVDGKPSELLRCNFIVRGVYLTPGTHTVEFHFKPPTGPLYVSLAAIALGICLIGYLAVYKKDTSADASRGSARSTVKPAHDLNRS